MNPPEILIKECLDQLHLGEPQTAGSLTLVPLLSDANNDPDYLHLDDAMSMDRVHISELSESGSVPELRLENSGELPVMLLDGEELAGAKQNRVLNLTVLAPAKSDLVIPVSCVEQGRWSYREQGFRPSGRAMYSKVRKKKMADVSYSLASHGSRRSNQGAIWQDIDEELGARRMESPTAAMRDAYDQQQAHLDEAREVFQPVEGQCGVIVFQRSRVDSVELFGCRASWQHYAPKLIDSFVFDAARHGDAPARRVNAHSGWERFRTNIEWADARQYDAIGLGRDLRLVGQHVAGAGLVADEAMLHLAVFRSENTSRTSGSRIRRRRYQ